jgi:hypothetical protein
LLHFWDLIARTCKVIIVYVYLNYIILGHKLCYDCCLFTLRGMSASWPVEITKPLSSTSCQTKKNLFEKVHASVTKFVWY